MAERLLPTPSTEQLTVVAWNILLDRKHGDLVVPQRDRIERHAKSLRELDRPLDAVGIFEVEKTTTEHNGTILAQQLGFEASYWQAHSRNNEYIGMFGDKVEDVEPLDLGYKKTALLTRIGEVCVVAVHLKFPRSTREHLWLDEQRQQVEVILERVKDEDHVVIMGDLNCSPRRKPRKLIEAQGFQSVYRAQDVPRPHTALRGEYDFMLTPRQRRVIRQVWPLGINVDDIYTKNMTVHEVGTVTGPSDHLGVWATLSPRTEAYID